MSEVNFSFPQDVESKVGIRAEERSKKQMSMRRMRRKIFPAVFFLGEGDACMPTSDFKFFKL